MINDLDDTLEKLLLADALFSADEIDISFDRPTSNWESDQKNKFVVNLYLYDIRESKTLRQYKWETVAINNNEARQQRPPLRLECTYLITCWAEEVKTRHLLLTRCLLALAKNAVIPKTLLQGSLQGMEQEVTTQVMAHDRLENPADLWSVMGNEIQPALTYCVTLPVDMKVDDEAVELVRDVEVQWKHIAPPSSSANNGREG